jgi:hypothetical protein
MTMSLGIGRNGNIRKCKVSNNEQNWQYLLHHNELSPMHTTNVQLLETDTAFAAPLMLHVQRPFLTQSSSPSFVSFSLPSTMPSPIPAWALPVSTNSAILFLARKCVSAKTGYFSS